MKHFAGKDKVSNRSAYARFGKPAGPQRSGVIETIAPIVDALLNNARAEGVRLSGGAVHRRLLSEGYNVGIASVYVCLRRIQASVS